MTSPSTNAFLRWLDAFPLAILILLALWMGVAPLKPEPHLVEKFRMLGNGTLIRPLDIFDLAFHCLPMVALVVRLYRQFFLVNK